MADKPRHGRDYRRRTPTVQQLTLDTQQTWAVSAILLDPANHTRALIMTDAVFAEGPPDQSLLQQIIINTRHITGIAAGTGSLWLVNLSGAANPGETWTAESTAPLIDDTGRALAYTDGIIIDYFEE